MNDYQASYTVCKCTLWNIPFKIQKQFIPVFQQAIKKKEKAIIKEEYNSREKNGSLKLVKMRIQICFLCIVPKGWKCSVLWWNSAFFIFGHAEINKKNYLSLFRHSLPKDLCLEEIVDRSVFNGIYSGEKNNSTWLSEYFIEYRGFKIHNGISWIRTWISHFETGDVTCEPLMIDYMATIFIITSLSHFLGDFSHWISRKVV